MKLTRNIKAQLFEIAAERVSFLRDESNCTDVFSAASKYSTPATLLEDVEEWLDDMCDNGHFSRWTSHGQGIYSDAENWLLPALTEVYEEFGIAV